MTVYVVRMLPDFSVRLLIWLAANAMYRIRTVGDENIPIEGALLVANHLSWVDALLIAASTGRMGSLPDAASVKEWARIGDGDARRARHLPNFCWKCASFFLNA